jgi:hypothetical protein
MCEAFPGTSPYLRISTWHLSECISGARVEIRLLGLPKPPAFAVYCDLPVVGMTTKEEKVKKALGGFRCFASTARKNVCYWILKFKYSIR